MLEAHGVTFAYGEHLAVAGVDLTVRPGELVALVGGNGSGKSTIARLLAGAQVPGEGRVVCDGSDTANPDERAGVRRLVGMVVQNPADQLVSTVVEDEVAFGPRNLGLGSLEVSRRVEDALGAVGLAGYERREVNALSGGEQQRLALAGVLAMEPSYLVLDEALAMVDSAERPALRALERELARDRGVGVVTVTHDPVEALGCDRIVVLRAGAVCWEGTPDALVRTQRALLKDVLSVGPYTRALCAAAEKGYSITKGVEPDEVARWLSASGAQVANDVRAALGTPGAQCSRVAAGAASGMLGPDSADEDGAASVSRPAAARGTASGRVLLAARGLAVSHGGEPVLHDVSLELAAGTVTLLAGESGAGKTTLATALAGLACPCAGTVELTGDRPAALAFQHPEGQLFLDTVEAELSFGPRELGCDEAETARRVRLARERLGIDDDLMARDPFALSGGQARRVALGCVLTLDAPVIILDEPTSGLDADARRRLHRVVRELAEEGRALMVISHDLEEWLDTVDCVALVAHGGISWSGTVGDLERDRGAFARAGLVEPEAWRLAALAGGAGSAGVAVLEGDGAPDIARTPAAPPSARREPQEAPVTGLAAVDARVKLILLFSAILALFFTHSPLVFAIWGAIAIVLGRCGGMGAARLVRSLRPVAVLLAFIVAANLVSCDGSAAVALVGPIGLNTAGAVRAAVAVARIALMVVLSLIVTATTTPVAVADACVRLGRPLARLGVPVDEIGLVLSLALRFIPLVTDEIGRVRLAQRSRGVRFDEGGLMERVRVWGTVLVPVMVGLFRRADHLGAAMDARCYHEGARRPHEPRPLADRDRVILIMGLVVIADLVLAGR